jgi:hypothetical protein
LQIIKTFIIAIPGGVLFYYLHVPLPWLLGPLTVIVIYNSIGNSRACWPFYFRDLALIILGYSMGRTVTLETARQILIDLPAMFAVTLLTIIFCIITGYITHRKTGISAASGMLGSMPGGLMQMVALSEEIKDSDLTIVTFMQTVRLLAVIFIVPFIATYGIIHVQGGLVLPATAMSQGDLIAALPAILMALLGALLAYRFKLPTPFLLGPIFFTAAASLCGYPALPVPRFIINLAQIFFSIHMGLSISLKSLKQLGKVCPYAIGGALALVAFTFFLGFVLTLVMPATLLSSFLSTAPGGITEMGLTAITLHADIATVLAFQLFRIFFILLIVPPLLKWRLNR